MVNNIILKSKLIVRNDTVDNWRKNNPKLAKGEFGYEIDTQKFKIGDGSNPWNDLKYVGAGTEDINNAIQTYLTGNLFDEAGEVKKIKKELLPEMQSPVIVYDVIKSDLQATDEEVIKAKVNEVKISSTINKGDIFIITTKESEIVFDLTGYIVASQPEENTAEKVWGALKPLNGNVDADKVILKENITLAGDYEQVGNISKSKTGTATFSTKGKSVADALTEIFSKEIYPSTVSTQGTFSIGLSAPSISANKSNNSVVAVGTEIVYYPVIANAYSESKQDSKVTGFIHGHAASKGGEITSTAVNTSWSIKQTPNSNYTLTASKSGYSGNLVSTEAENISASSCKIGGNTLKASFGDNIYTVTETSATATGSIAAIEPLYIVSNLKNTDENHKSTRVEGINDLIKSTSAKSSTHKVIGVYPVYSNANGDTNVEEATIERLEDENVFKVTFGVEKGSNFAKFSYPASHTLTVKVWNDMAQAFTDYPTLNADIITSTKNINGIDYSYSTWVRKGTQFTEPKEFEFTLSKSTSVK